MRFSQSRMISRAVTLTSPRVVALELRRRLGPAERRERPERGAEPGVEHVGVALERARAALGARLRRRPRAGQVPVGARPDRDLVAPPELPRDAPVGRLLEGLDREAVLALGVVADAPLAQRLDRRARELVHPAPPLGRDERLDPRVAALARPHRVAVGLALLELAALLEPGDDPRVGLRLRHALEALCREPAVRPDHGQRLEVVVAPDLEVDRVVAGRDLERARAELGLDARVGDHGHPPPDDRDDDLAADRVAIARVVRMDRDGDVGEHRRRPHGRDRDRAVAVGERVPRVDERVVDLRMLDLEVGDRRLVVRAPVDDPVRPVDPAGLPEAHEERHHRGDVRLVHREPLPGVVERGAEPAVLAHDRPAGLVEPAPRPLEERVAAELLPRGPLRDELLLDDVLRRDPGVVVAGLPQRVEPAHPVPADEDVLQRAVQRVPHVQLSGHVRRRHADHVALVAARARAGGVEPLGLPRLLPAPLDRGRVVHRLHGGEV